ncbi:NAD(P)-bindingprotein [Moniliophthora roreri]|nr:NAD(P)-bindingprotein [Moniliophthora roreri]
MPQKFTSNISRALSSGVPSISPSSVIPALLKTTSIRPKVFSAVEKTWLTSVDEVTSQRRSSSFEDLREARIGGSEEERPKPEDAPVTLGKALFDLLNQTRGRRGVPVSVEGRDMFVVVAVPRAPFRTAVIANDIKFDLEITDFRARLERRDAALFID